VPSGQFKGAGLEELVGVCDNKIGDDYGVVIMAWRTVPWSVGADVGPDGLAYTVKMPESCWQEKVSCNEPMKDSGSAGRH